MHKDAAAGTLLFQSAAKLRPKRCQEVNGGLDQADRICNEPGVCFLLYMH